MKKFLLFSIIVFAIFGFIKIDNANANGTLIKASRPAVYYFDNNTHKRYVFPNEKTYKTWYKDYSTVHTITDTELSNIPLGGNIVYRPGTRLVKITTDPRVYVVGQDGYLHWISNEALAIKLYGPNWKNLVSDIPDAFFTNYKYGNDLNYETYVDGSLIRYEGSSSIYIIKNGQKVLIPNQEFMNVYKFNNEFIQICPNSKIFETRSNALSYEDKRYWDVSQTEYSSSGEIHGTGVNLSHIPNVKILEFAVNDPCRQSTGNIRGDCLVERFYEENENNYDVLITIDLGMYEDKESGWSGWGVRRYIPYNIGMPLDPLLSDFPHYPSRLRYMQQLNDFWRKSNNRAFLHELGHTWGVGWRNACEEGEVWCEHTFEAGHWTELFQTGNTGASLMSYSKNMVSEGEVGVALMGRFTDNYDGTFTWEEVNPIFNYMDLYAMGLIKEEELAEQEMFTVINPIWLNPNASVSEDRLYSGTRYDLTLDDFKNLLQRKEDKEGLDYFTEDGNRRLHEYDNGIEWTTNPHVGIALIKFPEQEISEEDAYKICQKVNYEWIDAWDYATHGLSNLSTNLGDGFNPDCAALFNQ